MKVRNLLARLGMVLLAIVGFASCEEDFTNLDTTIVDGNFTTPDSVFSVKAYSKMMGAVQTSNQDVYKLGIYWDPVYGRTETDFLGQVVLSANNPTFPNDSVDPILEKVILSIPFFSDSSEDEEGNTVYTLDSVYGGEPINIGVYESNYQLRDFDPSTNFEEPQLYYSNQGPLFQANFGSLIGSQTDFQGTNLADEFIIEAIDTLSFNPGLNMELSVDFFQQKLVDQEGEEVLLNNNNFKEYFRGIYLKVDGGLGGTSFMFDTENVRITLYHSVNTYDSDGNIVLDEENEPVRGLNSFELLFSGVNVNPYTYSNFPSDIDLTNPNMEEGEERLYLRGGQGIATVIELFGGDDNQNGIDDLEELRDREWLINEANLLLYVDKDRVTGGSKEPERIMIFDTENNSILADYTLDLTSNLRPINAITEHLGRLERDSDGNGDYYKIKLTSHVSNLINRDSSNVKLGLVVSQNVQYVRFYETENPLLEDSFKEVPGGSIISPEGTVLHGNLSEDASKRLKLELYYTEPD